MDAGAGRPVRVRVQAVAVTLVAALVGLLVSSCGDDGAKDHDVFVIGDSVTFLSAAEIERRFDEERTQIVAVPGDPTSAVVLRVRDAIENATEGDPVAARDVVTVLVGYNDIRLDAVDAETLGDLMEITAEWDCAVWFTLPARPGGEDIENPGLPSGEADLWNQRIVDAAEPYDSVHVARDWETLVTEAPPDEMLESDRVHPLPSGQRRLADAQRAAVERIC